MDREPSFEILDPLAANARDSARRSAETKTWRSAVLRGDSPKEVVWVMVLICNDLQEGTLLDNAEDRGPELNEFGRARRSSAKVEREQHDVVCLQSEAEQQIPLSASGGLQHLLARLRGYAGVSLHVRKRRFDAEPLFSNPDSTWNADARRRAQP